LLETINDRFGPASAAIGAELKDGAAAPVETEEEAPAISTETSCAKQISGLIKDQWRVWAPAISGGVLKII
jgi:hypothetical protein